MRLFEADPVTGDYGPVESKPGLRAVPVNELADGVIIRPLGTLRREAVKDCRFRLFEISSRSGSFKTELGLRLRLFFAIPEFCIQAVAVASLILGRLY